jgi:hypothetical protein
MPRKLLEISPLKDLKFRKTLSMPALLKKVRQSFEKIADYRKGKIDYSLPDVLMSGLAIFSLKYPSLLAFDNDQDNLKLRHPSYIQKVVYTFFNRKVGVACGTDRIRASK